MSDTQHLVALDCYMGDTLVLLYSGMMSESALIGNQYDYDKIRVRINNGPPFWLKRKERPPETEEASVPEDGKGNLPPGMTIKGFYDGWKNR